MSLPNKLKNFNLFVDGESYVGQVPEVTLPKLARSTEEYRAGGMGGPVQSAMGLEGLEMQWKAGGWIRSLFKQWGNTTVAGVQLRFAGALQTDDTGAVTSVEAVVRGFHKEIDLGNQAAGEKTEVQVTSSLSYYKLSINGATVIEIDLVNMIEIVDGVDLMADTRSAIGV
jgi:P2 family phage contractile tail tube protein